VSDFPASSGFNPVLKGDFNGSRPTDALITPPPPPPDVYVLELAGERDDDAFARAEARAAATGVEPLAAGLATADSVAPERLRGLAFIHRASELVGRTDADPDAARALVDAAPIERSGTVAVRARDVRSTTGVSTAAVERALGDVLVDRGFAVDLDDPDHELRALFAAGDGPDADGVCAVGWLATAADRAFGERAPTDRPFFQPGSMDPILARAVCNLAGVGPGTRLLDPFCGTGGLLIEGALLGAEVVGVDAQAKMARGTARNLAATATDATTAVCRGDATRLPLADDAVDAVAFDAPYGRQSKIAATDLDDLVADALAEAGRVGRRCVLVADRDYADAAAAAGWTVDARFERRVHRSLVRHVHVLR
jgi:tRNA (guanine10-N2)-dimethyltransferase